MRNVFLLVMLSFALESAGCVSLSKKFARKAKADDETAKEVVFAPEEYKGDGLSAEERYRQYLLYWKSWQKELIDSLEEDGNRKRQDDALNEAIKNLRNMKDMLKSEAAARLQVIIGKMNVLRDELNRDIYGQSISAHRERAQQLQRRIDSDFSYSSVKDEML